MARRVLIRNSDFPYHLCARANNREPFPGTLEFIWKTFCSEIFVQQKVYDFRVHAFVLMPNHFHLLASSPHRGIDMVMKEFLGSATRIVNHRYRRSGRIFGGPYHWSLVSNALSYAQVLKYVYRNPVKAGIKPFASDYAFSTYQGIQGLSPLLIQMSPPPSEMGALVPDDFQELDRWLNLPHRGEVHELIRRGLRRKTFEISALEKTRRKLTLDL